MKKQATVSQGGPSKRESISDLTGVIKPNPPRAARQEESPCLYAALTLSLSLSLSLYIYINMCACVLAMTVSRIPEEHEKSFMIGDGGASVAKISPNGRYAAVACSVGGDFVLKVIALSRDFTQAQMNGHDSFIYDIGYVLYRLREREGNPGDGGSSW